MMDKSALQSLIYGGLLELGKNSKLFYNSSVSSHYAHLTEEGKEALVDYVNKMIPMMLANEEALLDKRAKELVLKNLKGENN